MAPENFERRELFEDKEHNRILAVRFRSNDAVSNNLEPVFIGPDSTHGLNSFIQSSIDASLGRIEKLEDPNQYKKKSHGQRGQRELGDIMENNSKLIEQREYALLVLTGKRLGAVEVTQDKDGNYTKLEVMPISDEQRELWEPIYSASRAAKNNPQALDLLVKAFNLRYQIKYGDFSTSEKAKSEFLGFRRKLGDFLDNNQNL